MVNGNDRDLAEWLRRELHKWLAAIAADQPPAPVFHANALIDAAKTARRTTRRFHVLQGGLGKPASATNPPAPNP